MSTPTTQDAALLSRARRLLHDHRTRARKDGQVLDYTLRDVRQLLAGSPCCAYCGAPVAWDVSLDHKVPTGRGGKHAFDNLAVCCRTCQAAKGQLDAGEYRRLLALLASFDPRAATDVRRRLAAGGRRYERRL